MRSISGTAVVGTNGPPVAGVRIRGVSSYPQGQPAPPDATAVTDSQGSYNLTFPTWTEKALSGTPALYLYFELPPGFVLVGVTGDAGEEPSYARDAAMLLVDSLGSGAIDITLGPGDVVEGKVTAGQTGVPLPGVQVSALRPNSLFIDGSYGDAFEIETSAKTDATGRYSLTVRPGPYVIYASGPDGAQRFWSDDPAVFQATQMSVDRAMAGIDIELVPVAVISGEFQSCGAPIVGGPAGVRVAAYLAGGTACCRTIGAAATDDNGTFLMFVPAGTYRIAFQPATGSPYAAQWWKGATEFENATDVTVGSSSVQLVVELGSPSP